MPARRGLTPLLCVAVSLAAHAWLMAGEWGDRQRHESRSTPLAVRTLAAAAPLSGASAEPAAPTALPEPVSVARVSAVPLPALSASTPAAELPPLPAVSLSAVTQQPGDEDGYIPRPRLSVVPVMQQALLLQWPPQWSGDGQYSEVLSLFIDEHGVVQRVRVEGAGLPEVFEQQARQAFLGARFSPGQLSGREVKSLIRVEVTFEARPQALEKGAR